MNVSPRESGIAKRDCRRPEAHVDVSGFQIDEVSQIGNILELEGYRSSFKHHVNRRNLVSKVWQSGARSDGQMRTTKSIYIIQYIRDWALGRCVIKLLYTYIEREREFHNHQTCTTY